MSDYTQKVEAIRGARAGRNDTAEELSALKHRFFTAAKGISEPGRDNEGGARLERAIKRKRAELEGATERLEGLRSELLADIPPERLIGFWDDGLPITLLPLRVETKYRLDPAPAELRVRAFPDDIAVVTHEQALTKTEGEHGVAYWTALAGAADDKARKVAWRMVADRFGPNRAAWVVLATKPVNWTDPTPDADALEFPTPEMTKPADWTEAPHTNILPDCLVLLAFREGKPPRRIVGKPIKDRLTLGPAPLEDGNKPSIVRDPLTGRLDYGSGLRWLGDFDLAVEEGLAFRVPLDADEAVHGFDKLLVIGLKHSADQQDGQALLEALFENHHYSRKGLGLVPQGAPTNNTDERDAAFASRDPLQVTSFVTETGKPLFEPTDSKEEATDGQRLAEYLGIAYEPFQHVANADRRDYAEAVAMNEALYAGTLGYYLDSMLNEVVDETAQARLRRHFTAHVTGRGPVAAIRVGNQPYGILPTAPFERWTYPVSRLDRSGTFYTSLHKILAEGEKLWEAMVPQLPHISASGDTSTSLMGVLGLNPASVEFFQRVGYSADHLANLADLKDGGKAMMDLYKTNYEASLARLMLADLGYRSKRNDGTAKPTPMLLQIVFRDVHTRLAANNLIDGLPLSEERGIKAYDAAGLHNYIDWLLAATDSDTLEDEDFGAATAPTSLLYLMLRYAMLHETTRSIVKFLDKHAIDASAFVRSRKFANISAAPTASHWEMFQAPVAEIVPAEGVDTPLFAFLHSDRFAGGDDEDVVLDLNANKRALGILKGVPTARLERCLVEHLDTLSYRLDAWEMSLFDQRLRQQRGLDAKASERRLGAYVGAYGYLENVRPARAGSRVRVPEDILPEALREGKDNLHLEPRSGGYVHAPSLNHATAAAILRNAYLTHATPEEPDLLAVNLTSERVRRARAIIEGARNGQTLEELLGYEFERGLHEWTTRATSPVILNDLIPALRLAFPILRTKIPQAGNVTGPEETVKDYKVVNGLAVAQAAATFPTGVDLGALDGPKITALQAEKKNVENSLDAVRDTLVAEAAYQLAMGNFDRAAAVMQSLASAEIPTEIEVTDTPRGVGLSFTNRIMLHFDPTVTASPWTGIAMSPRANAEPGLNHWLGGMIGDPAKIQSRVRGVDADGKTLHRADASELSGFVSLRDLEVQPLDLLYLVRNAEEATGPSELESRIRAVFAKAEALDDDVIVDIAFADAGSAPLSFAEILQLVRRLREILASARPLGATLFTPGSMKVTAPADNPDNIDVPELRLRVQDAIDALDPLKSALDTAITGAQPAPLRKALRGLADAGIAMAWPQSTTGTTTEILLSQGKSVQRQFEDMVARRSALLVTADAPATKPPQRVEALINALKLSFGDDLICLPRFSFNNSADVAAAWTDRAQILAHARGALGRPLVVEEFLHGAAAVRPQLHRLQLARLCHDMFGGGLMECEPIQLPHRTSDSWLAVEFPPGTDILHDTISILLFAPQGFDPTAVQAGLLLDQWTEAIPSREEVTGLTFNYNNPNSVPPQAILLAMAPRIDGNWQWDDLVDGVLDAFARAKRRAIEPDKIDANGRLTALLPALLAEFSTSPFSVSLDYMRTIDRMAFKIDSLKATLGGG